VSSATDIGTALAAWNDFFVASTGAAAVLLGLTFVGLTIHVERQGLDSLRRGLAIGSATSLLYALFASLLMLMPEGVPNVQAFGLVLIGLFGFISAEAAMANARRAGTTRARLAFQFVLPGIAIGLLLLAGIALALGVQQAVWGAAGVVFVLITSGTQSAWDLLFSFTPESAQVARNPRNVHELVGHDPAEGLARPARHRGPERTREAAREAG
jgi:hypothetical protein